MQLHATEHPFTTNLDISSAAFWAKSPIERDETFAWLRANAPVSWHRPMDESPMSPAVHQEKGFWAVVNAADIQYVSQNDALFSSALGGVAVQPVDPAAGRAPSFLEMDQPEHAHFRRLISAGFTPRAVSGLREKIVERAGQIVDAVTGAGEFDFVERVAARLPMLTIADMVGVPDSQIEEFTTAGINIAASASQDISVFLENFNVLREMGLDLVRHRRKHPRDDIATAIAQGEVDGQPLSDDQIASYVMLLASAGNDTTKYTTAWTMLNLASNPHEKAWLLKDFDERITPSIEEFLRHASVVTFFARTATQDTELGGRHIAAGDKVAMFYCSGNRDERLFPDPHRFDLSRPRANHVVFGGGGVHHCLGHLVAKAQLRAIFNEVLTKLPDIELAGEPSTGHTAFFDIVTRLPVRA